MRKYCDQKLEPCSSKTVSNLVQFHEFFFLLSFHQTSQTAAVGLVLQKCPRVKLVYYGKFKILFKFHGSGSMVMVVVESRWLRRRWGTEFQRGRWRMKRITVERDEVGGSGGMCGGRGHSCGGRRIQFVFHYGFFGLF